MKIKFGEESIELFNQIPREEGFYIWFCNMFPESATPRLVQIVMKPTVYHGGIEFVGYLSVDGHHSVEKYDRPCDFWSEKIEWK